MLEQRGVMLYLSADVHNVVEQKTTAVELLVQTFRVGVSQTESPQRKVFF